MSNRSEGNSSFTMLTDSVDIEAANTDYLTKILFGLVSQLILDFASTGDPTTSYATAGIALGFTVTTQPSHRNVSWPTVSQCGLKRLQLVFIERP